MTSCFSLLCILGLCSQLVFAQCVTYYADSACTTSGDSTRSLELGDCMGREFPGGTRMISISTVSFNETAWLVHRWNTSDHCDGPPSDSYVTDFLEMGLNLFYLDFGCIDIDDYYTGDAVVYKFDNEPFVAKSYKSRDQGSCEEPATVGRVLLRTLWILAIVLLWLLAAVSALGALYLLYGWYRRRHDFLGDLFRNTTTLLVVNDLRRTSVFGGGVLEDLGLVYVVGSPAVQFDNYLFELAVVWLLFWDTNAYLKWLRSGEWSYLYRGVGLGGSWLFTTLDVNPPSWSVYLACVISVIALAVYNRYLKPWVSPLSHPLSAFVLLLAALVTVFLIPSQRCSAYYGVSVFCNDVPALTTTRSLNEDWSGGFLQLSGSDAVNCSAGFYGIAGGVFPVDLENVDANEDCTFGSVDVGLTTSTFLNVSSDDREGPVTVLRTVGQFATLWYAYCLLASWVQAMPSPETLLSLSRVDDFGLGFLSSYVKRRPEGSLAKSSKDPCVSPRTSPITTEVPASSPPAVADAEVAKQTCPSHPPPEIATSPSETVGEFEDAESSPSASLLELQTSEAALAHRKQVISEYGLDDPVNPPVALPHPDDGAAEVKMEAPIEQAALPPSEIPAGEEPVRPRSSTTKSRKSHKSRRSRNSKGSKGKKKKKQGDKRADTDSPALPVEPDADHDAAE